MAGWGSYLQLVCAYCHAIIFTIDYLLSYLIHGSFSADAIVTVNVIMPATIKYY